jgi:hypothetical protein
MSCKTCIGNVGIKSHCSDYEEYDLLLQHLSLLSAFIGFFLDLVFNPHDGDGMFLRKVELCRNNTALQYGKP